MRVVFNPDIGTLLENPYWKTLQNHLKSNDVEFVSSSDPLYLQWRWLVKHRGKVDVIHFHFLRHHYTANESTASFRQLIRFVGKLLLAKILGYRIIWTAHNLYPHERLKPHIIGYFVHLAVALLSKAIIVHCVRAKEAIKQEYLRRRNVIVVPHPNYIDIYPNTMSREIVRDFLGLSSQDCVFLFLGAIREYKGIRRLISEFQKLEGQDLHLLIVGKPWNENLKLELISMAKPDNRIQIHPHFIKDEDLQTYFNSADAVVLPFEDIFSSGSAMLSMSFKRPVIAPSIGCLPDLINDRIGILYDQSDQDGLRKALIKAQSLDLMQMGEDAYKFVEQFTWLKMAMQTLSIYCS